LPLTASLSSGRDSVSKSKLPQHPPFPTRPGVFLRMTQDFTAFFSLAASFPRAISFLFLVKALLAPFLASMFFLTVGTVEQRSFRFDCFPPLRGATGRGSFFPNVPPGRIAFLFRSDSRGFAALSDLFAASARSSQVSVPSLGSYTINLGNALFFFHEPFLLSPFQFLGGRFAYD